MPQRCQVAVEEDVLLAVVLPALVLVVLPLLALAAVLAGALFDDAGALVDAAAAGVAATALSVAVEVPPSSLAPVADLPVAAPPRKSVTYQPVPFS